ncbi:hypothetical protein ACFXHA_33075 [Nocardia sp. NPDC059240]|uniref:hypothetical protein n=1 Tax=Nocardia sp. NPDC059240 TaxID=3346786 RepID=UPI0036A28CDE
MITPANPTSAQGCPAVSPPQNTESMPAANTVVHIHAAGAATEGRFKTGPTTANASATASNPPAAKGNGKR